MGDRKLRYQQEKKAKETDLWDKRQTFWVVGSNTSAHTRIFYAETNSTNYSNKCRSDHLKQMQGRDGNDGPQRSPHTKLVLFTGLVLPTHVCVFSATSVSTQKIFVNKKKKKKTLHMKTALTFWPALDPLAWSCLIEKAVWTFDHCFPFSNPYSTFDPNRIKRSNLSGPALTDDLT